MSSLLIIFAGLMIERAFGYPNWLFKAIKHPVVWIGAMIRMGEQHLNTGPNAMRLAKGAALSLIVIATTASVAVLMTELLGDGLFGMFIQSLLAASLLAWGSLSEHVKAVAEPLKSGDLPAARQAVAMIVGRDTQDLDEAGIASAALESLSENTGDGIVAPVFWGVLFGLPGIAAYKAINTLDSMIGYRNERYEYFGKFAARLDDVVNFIPARITGVLFAGLSVSAYRVILKDAGKHRSPNAGWAEAAFAARLGVRLSGPRIYEGQPTDDPYLNAEGRVPGAIDLERGLRLLQRAMGALALALILLWYLQQ